MPGKSVGTWGVDQVSSLALGGGSSSDFHWQDLVSD